MSCPPAQRTGRAETGDSPAHGASQARGLPVIPLKIAARAAHLLLLAFAACSTPAEDKVSPVTVEPPNCTAVASFGNGALCSASSEGMAACGASKRRVCAAARLCFDAPEYAFCACDKDADCNGRAAYINKARLRRDQEPIDVLCHGGRCAGAP